MAIVQAPTNGLFQAFCISSALLQRLSKNNDYRMINNKMPQILNPYTPIKI
jgi:hypothetical protein